MPQTSTERIRKSVWKWTIERYNINTRKDIMMNTAIKYENGNFYITDDDNILTSVLASMTRNNTFFPNVRSAHVESVLKTKKDEKGNKVVDKDGKLVKVRKDVLTVSFSDGTWTSVTRSESDDNDLAMAFMYAIMKRLFGKPNDAGYVEGDGFMGKLKNLVKNIKTEESENEKKRKRLAEKEEADRKAHEDAVARRNRNPSIGSRLHSLEDKFNTLMDFLGRNKTENDKRDYEKHNNYNPTKKRR